MLWLYIHFPSLQLDSFLTHNEVSEDTAVIVVDAISNEIIQLNQAAIRAGMQLKMGLASAAVLCQDLRVVPFQKNKEVKLLQHIAQTLYQVSADIAFYQSHGLFLKVNNMLRLYDSIEDYWRSIVNRLQIFNIHYCGAMAYSAYSAQILARANIQLISADKKQIVQQLKALPISALLLPEKSLANFYKLGIKTIKQWLALPFAEFACRFNPQENEYFALVKGLQREKFTFYQPKTEFSYELELLYEIKSSDVLAHPLKKILQRLEHFLQQKNLLTQQLVLYFFSRDSAHFTLTVASVAGEYRANKWLELTMLQLEKVQLSAPITIINIEVKEFQNLQGETDDLLAGKRGQLKRTELMSLLLNRLGKKQIFTLHLLTEHCPEKASAYRDIDSDITALVDNVKHQKIPLRPSFLLPAPEQLDLQVEVLHGPERIQNAWWQQHEIIRDYFIAKNQHGQWCWIYRQPDKQWFLHGFFA